MRTSLLLILAIFIYTPVYAKTETEKIEDCYAYAKLIRIIANQRDKGLYPSEVEKELVKYDLAIFRAFIPLVFKYPGLTPIHMYNTSLRKCIDDLDIKGNM